MRILKRPFITGSFLLLLSLFLLPALVLASESGYVFGTIRRDVWDLILRIINFVVLVGVLVYFVRKPLVGAIRNSIESVRKLLKEAEESRKASEAHMKESEEKLAGIDKEINDLLEAARREGEAERERILSEASIAVEKLKAEAAMAIDLELKKAQDVLRKEAADAAVALAEEIIGKNVTPEDQARFVTEYLEKLEVKQ
jgi:F-type H+-transporting ATPase subunit b